MATRPFATKCKLCSEPVVKVVRRDLSSELISVVINKSRRITACRPSEAHPSGLCYFHLKEAVGLFDAKYPIEKHGKADGQMTIMKEAMMRTLGHKPRGFRQDKTWQQVMKEMP